jgi:hypothetical protein
VIIFSLRLKQKKLHFASIIPSLLVVKVTCWITRTTKHFNDCINRIIIVRWLVFDENDFEIIKENFHGLRQIASFPLAFIYNTIYPMPDENSFLITRRLFILNPDATVAWAKTFQCHNL